MLIKYIDEQVKDGFQDQFKQSFAPIELEGELKEQEYETEDVIVQIVELSTDELAKSNNWIGANRPVYTDDSTHKSNRNGRDNDSDGDDSDGSQDEGSDEEEVPGFTVTSTRKVVRKQIKPTAKTEDEAESIVNPDVPEEKKKQPRTKKLPEDLKSKRALGQYFAKKEMNTLQHSKAFQTKNKLERIRNKKKARIEKDKRIKLQNKREKHKKKPTKSAKVDKKFNKNKKGARK